MQEFRPLYAPDAVMTYEEAYNNRAIWESVVRSQPDLAKKIIEYMKNKSEDWSKEGF